MGDTLARAEADTATSSPGVDSPQIDNDSVTMEQLDKLFETGKAELPVKSSGGEKSGEPVKGADAGAEPQRVSPGIRETSRTAEQIEADATAAMEAVRAQGGDQKAQETAAEAARAGATGATGPAMEETGATGATGATGPNEPVGATGATGPAARPTEEEEEIQRIQRPRLKNPVDQAIAAVFKAAENSGNPISWAEAERRVKGDQEPDRRETVAEPDLSETVTALTTEVTEIKRKLQALGADEGVYNPEIAELTIELADKTADLKMAQRDVQDAQEAARDIAEEASQTWRQAAGESRARAINDYPDVADSSTPLGKAVAQVIDAMQDPSHPDHNLLYAASAAETIAAREARKLGIAPVTKQAAPSARKEVVVPAVEKMRPVSGAKSSASDQRPEDSKKKIVDYAKSDEVSLQDLDAIQGVGEPSEKLKPLLAGVR